MKKIELIQSIKQQDLILANAVSKMVDYIQDKWAAPYPSKEQTEAVNDYLRSVHANGDGTIDAIYLDATKRYDDGYEVKDPTTLFSGTAEGFTEGDRKVTLTK